MKISAGTSNATTGTIIGTGRHKKYQQVSVPGTSTCIVTGTTTRTVLVLVLLPVLVLVQYW